jgi:NhaP-type Na+/H+ or K+/H+ antiporter
MHTLTLILYFLFALGTGIVVLGCALGALELLAMRRARSRRRELEKMRKGL